MQPTSRWGAVALAAVCWLGGACSAQQAGVEQAGESLFVLGQAQQPVLMEGTVFGDALPSKTVILTYDDGPDEHTLELAQFLADNDIRATFFINGRRICKTLADDGSCQEPMDTRACDNGLAQAPVAEPIYYPESLLHQLVQLGHRLGNHTVDHCHLPAQDNPESFVFELQGTQDIVDRHICDGLFVFRAPYGEWDAQAAALAQAEPGLDKLVGPIQWDIDGLDWSCYQQGTPIETCGDGYLNLLRARPLQNGIFLLHDRPEFNVGSEGPLLLAQYLVPILKAEGFQFTTLDDLLDHTATGDLACPFDDGSGGAGAGGSNNGGFGGLPVAAGGGGGQDGTNTPNWVAGAAGAAGVGGGATAGMAGQTSTIEQPNAAMGSGGNAGTVAPSSAAGGAAAPEMTNVEQGATCDMGRSSGVRSVPWSLALLVGSVLWRRRRNSCCPR